MGAKPYGSPCRLFCDWAGDPPPEPGWYLRSNGGSVYFIDAQRPTRGRPSRLVLSCIRTDPADVPTDAVVYDFTWYPRKKRS
ncbi:MAG: hypothetical protein ACO1SX_23150 [Actinomycetota bacterium]